jgi:radical SAM additional 4Fe4S-binding domain
MLQTNGTLVNQEIIDLIKELNINVGVSIDGINCHTNRARIFENSKSTVEYVIKNITRLLSENIKLGIFSVLTAYNSNSMLDLIKHFGNIGVQNFVINPLVLWGNAKNMNELMATQNQVYESYKQIIDWLGDYNTGCEQNKRITERNLHWWYKSLTDGTKGYMCNSSPCGAGNQTIAISPIGDVYVCDQYYGDSKFLVGNLKTTNLEDIMINAKPTIIGLRNIFNIETCKQCIWRYVCCGGCCAASYYYNQNMYSVAPY